MIFSCKENSYIHVQKARIWSFEGKYESFEGKFKSSMARLAKLEAGSMGKQRSGTGKFSIFTVRRTSGKLPS